MARKAIYKHATQVNTSSYPDDGSSPVGTNEWNEAPDQAGMYGNTPTTATVTIASGILTVTDSVTVAAAEAGTSDTLDKLAIANTSQYDLIYLFADTGDTITLTNTSSPSADGHIKTISGANETLSTTKPTILIRKGNYWYGYGGGSSTFTPTSTDTLTNKTFDANGTGNSITNIENADINASAAIVYSKLSLSNSVTNADLAGSIANGKLATDPLARANHTGTQAHTTISDFDTGVQTNRLDQMATATADIAVGSQKITGLADGTAAQDAATKNQVDVAQAGLDAKDSCRVATTANITLSGEQTIDGVTTTTDRVLVKNQTTGSQNGIYVSAAGAWARSTDADANVEVTAGLYTLITEGTVAGGQGFVLTTDDPITVGTTALTFSQFSGVGDLVGGTGITKTGNSIAVDASQTQVTAVGALNTGSITSGFGNINNGSSTITTTGAVATGALTVTGGITGALTGNASTATTATTVSNDAITLAKMASGTDGNLITYDTNGDPAHVATGTATHVLTSNGAGVAPTFQAAAGGGATIVHKFSNTQTIAYLGTASSFGTVGVGDRDIYIKKIDSNNEGVFTKIWKNGSATEVQIA